MKSHRLPDWGGSVRRLMSPAKIFPILLLITAAASWAAGTVTNCTEENLRAAMTGGGMVTFACNGTINLLNTISNSMDTLLDSSSAQICISGGGAGRVFFLKSNVSLTLSHLKIADGRADVGAGIYNAGGQLVLQDCTFTNNLARGGEGASYSGNPGTNGCGGAVFNLGTLVAVNCSFLSNTAAGGAGAFALYPSGSGGAGADGNGGAIANFGSAFLNCCLLANNSAVGGAGAAGNSGTYGFPAGDGGAGGAGGAGNGGAFFNGGSAILVNTTVALNIGSGGLGGPGGSGAPPMNQSQWTGNGGHGGVGGSGVGGICDLGQLSLTNSTLAANTAIAGLGGAGGPAGPWIYPYPPRLGSPGGNGADGAPGAGIKTSGAALLNTLLASNSPANCTGYLNDLGNNLSSDESCAFTSPYSLNATAPRLGDLAANGGPTWTMALSAGSPAIDAGCSIGAPGTDQRGVQRPQGNGVDIGAYEFEFTLRFTRTMVQSPTSFGLEICGLPEHAYTLQASTNLLNWFDVTNILTGADGTSSLLDEHPCGDTLRFYRLKGVMP